MPDEDLHQGDRHRVRVFIDFWNFSLSMRDVEEAFRADWSRLGPELAQAASEIADATATGVYQGLNFYGSYDPASDRDRRLNHWATTVVDTFPA